MVSFSAILSLATFALIQHASATFRLASIAREFDDLEPQSISKFPDGSSFISFWSPLTISELGLHPAVLKPAGPFRNKTGGRTFFGRTAVAARVRDNQVIWARVFDQFDSRVSSAVFKQTAYVHGAYDERFGSRQWQEVVCVSMSNGETLWKRRVPITQYTEFVFDYSNFVYAPSASKVVLASSNFDLKIFDNRKLTTSHNLKPSDWRYGGTVSAFATDENYACFLSDRDDSLFDNSSNEWLNIRYRLYLHCVNFDKPRTVVRREVRTHFGQVYNSLNALSLTISNGRVFVAYERAFRYNNRNSKPSINQLVVETYSLPNLHFAEWGSTRRTWVRSKMRTIVSLPTTFSSNALLTYGGIKVTGRSQPVLAFTSDLKLTGKFVDRPQRKNNVLEIRGRFVSPETTWFMVFNGTDNSKLPKLVPASGTSSNLPGKTSTGRNWNNVDYSSFELYQHGKVAKILGKLDLSTEPRGNLETGPPFVFTVPL